MEEREWEEGGGDPTGRTAPRGTYVTVRGFIRCLPDADEATRARLRYVQGMDEAEAQQVAEAGARARREAEERKHKEARKLLRSARTLQKTQAAEEAQKKHRGTRNQIVDIWRLWLSSRHWTRRCRQRSLPHRHRRLLNLKKPRKRQRTTSVDVWRHWLSRSRRRG